MGKVEELYKHSMVHPDVAAAYVSGKTVNERIMANEVPDTSVAAQAEWSDNNPVWEETGRVLTSTDCVKEEGDNTGMAIKTYTVTYTDVNPDSKTYNQTKEETETETVQDLENCPLPSTDPVWEETDRELTNTECIKEDDKNTGMAIKTYTVTYTDTNKHSATYNTTKEETETETVEDTEACPIPTLPGTDDDTSTGAK